MLMVQLLSMVRLGQGSVFSKDLGGISRYKTSEDGECFGYEQSLFSHLWSHPVTIIFGLW